MFVTSVHNELIALVILILIYDYFTIIYQISFLTLSTIIFWLTNSLSYGHQNFSSH